MTNFVTFFAVLWVISIALNLRDLASGGLPRQTTRGAQAFLVFTRCVYLAWAIWLLAKGA